LCVSMFYIVSTRCYLIHHSFPHDALPILDGARRLVSAAGYEAAAVHDKKIWNIVRAVVLVNDGTLGKYHRAHDVPNLFIVDGSRDRKSTRLNSSHGSISYAVFCLKKKSKI